MNLLHPQVKIPNSENRGQRVRLRINVPTAHCESVAVWSVSPSSSTLGCEFVTHVLRRKPEYETKCWFTMENNERLGVQRGSPSSELQRGEMRTPAYNVFHQSRGTMEHDKNPGLKWITIKVCCKMDGEIILGFNNTYAKAFSRISLFKYSLPSRLNPVKSVAEQTTQL